MLMDKNNKTIAYERAECARAVEYMRCMTEDAFMSDRFVQIEMADKNFNESVDTKENREILKNLTVESDEDKDEEIQRIVDATHDLSIDEMLGIQKSAGDYEMDAFVEGANMDLMRDVKSQIPDIKNELKNAKKKINRKEYDSAKKDINNVISKCQKLKKYVKEMDDTSLEKLIGTGFMLGLDGLVTCFVSTGLTTFGLNYLTKAEMLEFDNFFTLNSLSVLKDTPNAIKIKNDIEKLNKIGTRLSIIGAIASIVHYLDVIIKVSKACEGKMKMLDKKMDKDGWWKYLTNQSVNPYRTYIYQILDENEILANRYLKSIDKLKELEKEN